METWVLLFVVITRNERTVSFWYMFDFTQKSAVKSHESSSFFPKSVSTVVTFSKENMLINQLMILLIPYSMQLINQLIIDRSINQSIIQSITQSITRLVGQWMNEWMNQSINQPINHQQIKINKSTTLFKQHFCSSKCHVKVVTMHYPISPQCLYLE